MLISQFSVADSDFILYWKIRIVIVRNFREEINISDFLRISEEKKINFFVRPKRFSFPEKKIHNFFPAASM